MLDKSHKPTWTSFEEATKADWDAVMEYEEAYNAALPDRILDAIRSLDEEWTPYPVNRYQHSLQAATRAYEDGADEELVVAALIHELLKSGSVDLDYLARYANAGWLVIDDPEADDHGLFVRDDDDNPLCYDKSSKELKSALLPEITPALVGQFELADGRKAVTAFQLLSQRFLDERYSPDAVADQIGVAAETTRRIAAELAHTAFAEEISLDIAWTDWAGRKHEKTTGRPVSMHAMRGISAHSNGFHTCRMIHILQVLLGTIDCPGGFRYKPPYPKQTPPWLKPSGKRVGNRLAEPLGGPHLGFPIGPEDLLVNPSGSAQRIDKAFSWEAPLAAHGLMHMVINNAAKADPYPIDVLFLYMANMGWNSSMNVAATLKNLTDTNPETGEYVIPKVIYSDAYYSETVPYADLILPDTTYLERWDCISMLDRPISEPDSASDAIRHPVVKPDRDVRPFQDVLIELGARLGLPKFCNEDGTPAYPGGYPDYLVNHERKPGVGPLTGFRGEDGQSYGVGAPNPDQLERYIENGSFYQHHLRDDQRYYKHANQEYNKWAVDMGHRMLGDQIIFQLYLEPMQKFRLAAQGKRSELVPHEHKKRVETYFDPLPLWYMPLEEELAGGEDYPLHAVTQRPMAMYHSWGSQNAWLRQIHGRNWIYLNRERGEELDIADGDWIWITSPHGKVKAQAKLMDGVNRHTVWTWNAIGKRSGAWNLDPKAPEATKGFLLNHVISELLPDRGGYRYSNSDPVTGQAAWYDLRVRIEKAEPEEQGRTAPEFEPQTRAQGLRRAPDDVAFTGRKRKGAK